MTIAGMILVNNPGTWSTIYPPLAHAEWHGWTPTDLIFPFFLFIVGVSMVFSFSARLDLGQQGDLFLLLYLGILPANLASGPTSDRFGHRPVLLGSSLLVMLALLGFAAATGFAPAAFAAILRVPENL